LSHTPAAHVEGKRLADELIRRLLASRCMTVRYPIGCKDADQVLMPAGIERRADA
jgi:hypothetical protein